MKAYTITCHDVYNAGASLQAYALQHYLLDCGIDHKIIDYKPDYLADHFSLITISNPKFDHGILKYVYLLIKLPGRLKKLFGLKKKRFDQFKKDYLILTEKRYTSNDDLKKNLPEADLYIAGSDQIWNTVFKNGKDPAFYLDFAPDNKVKASYAASFATTDILVEYKEFVKKQIERLDYVGVRETSAVDIIKKLGINNSQQVVDPVFLLSREQWDELEKYSDMKLFNDKYIIVYDFDNNDKIKKVCKKIAKERNLKIYSFFKNSYADIIVDDYGPIEFISLIKNSQYVISNSFHGTTFAIIYKKDFLVINREEKINTRMKDLVELLDLNNRLLNDENFALESIDYENVNRILKKIIDESKCYLLEVINEKG